MGSQSEKIVPVQTSILPAVDGYDDLKLSDLAKDRLAMTLMSASVGLVSMTPLICRGSGCPFLSRCPIYIEDAEGATYPIDRQCIVELNLARNRFMSYVEEFNLANKVDESPTLRSQLSKLADFDVYEYRLKLILAGVTGKSDGTLLLDQAIALGQGGEVVEQMQEHPAWKVLERIQKQRMELLDALGATIRRKVWIDVATKRTSDDGLLSKQRMMLERIDSLLEKLDEE